MSAPASRRPVLFVAVTTALAAAALVLVVWHPFPLGADGWAWPAPPKPSLAGAGEPLAIYGLVLAIVVVAWRRIRRATWLGEAALVALLVALAFLAQLAVGRQSPSGYQESILAISQPGPMRYHKVARGVERLGPLLRDYDQWMRDGSHKLIITHAAGPVSFLWCLNHVYAGDEAGARRFVRSCEDWLSSGLRLGDSPWAARLLASTTPAELAGAWLASLAMRLLACLMVVPVYAFARRLYGRRGGLAAAAFAAAIPSLLLFSPGFDQCFPVVAATACLFAWTAGLERSSWRAFAAGFAVSAGLFFSLAFAVVALWGFLLTLAGLRRGGSPLNRQAVVKLAAFAAAGFLLPVAALYAVFRYNSFAVWWACWRANAEFNAQSGRVYWKWLLINPVDFLGFVGVPVACLFVRRLASEARELWRRGSAGASPSRGRDWPLLAAAGLLVTLNVLGGNRGEVARLWMFLMPACAVAAGGELGRLRPYRRAVFIVLFALQCVQVVVFKGFLSVLLGLYRPLAG